MAKRPFLIGIVCLIAGACSYPANMLMKLTPEEHAYLERAMAQPLTFMVTPEDSNMKWGVAQAFIAKHASMKIETVSDIVLETYNPYGGRYGYRVIRTPKKDGDEFFIVCLNDNMFLSKSTEQNAHIFAHYLVTDEIIERLIKR